MDWQVIREEYENTKITLKALAEKHDVKIGTLKSRKSREKWSRDTTKKDATKKEKVATPEPVIKNEELTDKQQMFCLYYTKYFNASKAYQKAYGCDYESAMRSGHRLMKNVEITKEIERIKQERFQGVAIDGMAILQKYIDIAFADITDYTSFGRREIEVINDIGQKEKVEVNYVDFKDHDQVDGTVITEVRQGKDGVSIKLADKMKALEFLSKYVDLLSDNDKKRLQEEKLKADIEKSKAETKNEEEGTGRVVIVNDKESMRKAMQNDGN